MKTLQMLNEMERANRYEARNELRADVATLKQTYRDTRDGKPADTVAAYIEAVGYRRAVATIATLANRHGWDGRIRHSVTLWAASVADAWDEEAAVNIGAYVDDVIHLANFDMIAAVMMRTPEPEQTQTAEEETPTTEPETAQTEQEQTTAEETAQTDTQTAPEQSAPEQTAAELPATDAEQATEEPRTETAAEPEEPETAQTTEAAQEPESATESTTETVQAVAAEPETTPEQTTPQRRGHAPVAQERPAWENLRIIGHGWAIMADKATERIRVITEGKPSKAARDILKKEGFFWAPSSASWVKGYTWRGYRAALRAADALRALVG